MTDPIADMLNRIKNGQAVLKETIEFPFSKIKYELASILERNGLVEAVERIGKKNKKLIKITLGYKDNVPLILGLRRVSKPGQRIYVDFKNIKRVKGGYGVSIISTPKGLMTNKEARNQKIGGEIICEIW